MRNQIQLLIWKTISGMAGYEHHNDLNEIIPKLIDFGQLLMRILQWIAVHTSCHSALSLLVTKQSSLQMIFLILKKLRRTPHIVVYKDCDF